MIFKPGPRHLQLPRKDAPPLPRPMAIASNAVKAIGRNVTHVARGNRPTVDTATAAHRLQICESCPLFNSENERCTHPHCGCFAKIKTWLTAEKCPEGKW